MLGNFGLEMLINTAVKAMGVDPATFVPQMQSFVKAVWDKVTEFDKRLYKMEANSNEDREQNRALVAFIRKHHPELFAQPKEEENGIERMDQ